MVTYRLVSHHLKYVAETSGKGNVLAYFQKYSYIVAVRSDRRSTDEPTSFSVINKKLLLLLFFNVLIAMFIKNKTPISVNAGGDCVTVV